jgi:hypothetical protein
MKNKYEKWCPLERIPARLYCEGLHDDYEGFHILLRGGESSSRMLRIAFDPALVYRNIDDGDLLKTICTLSEPEVSSLFTVENSTWLEWLHEESHGIHDGEAIIHYAIYTANDCIDVLSAFEPTVEWISL